MTTSLLELTRSVIEHLIRTMGYGGIALLMAIENLVPPLPSELVMPFAGFLVSTDEMAAIPALLMGTLGSLLGASILYVFGSWLGEERLRLSMRRYGRFVLLRESDLDRALALFRRRGRSVVFWARLVPGIRSLVSLPAGLTHMPLAPFVLYTALGALVWNSVLLTSGIVLGRNWSAVLELVDRYEALLLTASAALLAAFVWRRLVARRPRTDVHDADTPCGAHPHEPSFELELPPLPELEMSPPRPAVAPPPSRDRVAEPSPPR